MCCFFECYGVHRELYGLTHSFPTLRAYDLIDVNPVIGDIEEVLKPLRDTWFRGLAQDVLKTDRKRNALMMLGTQSPADALRSDIAETIIEQCPTKILLPNPNAQARDRKSTRLNSSH